MTAPKNTEESWEVVEQETATKVIFDVPKNNPDGLAPDVFTGVKTGQQVIEIEGEDPFTQYQFRGWGEFDNQELFGINESYKLNALEKIPNGMLVRITFMKTIDVKKGNPMKDFRVEQRKIPAADTAKYAEYL